MFTLNTVSLYNEIDVTVPAYYPGNRSRDHLGNLPFNPKKIVGSLSFDVDSTVT